VRQKDAGKMLADAFEVYAGEWERAVLFSGYDLGSGTGAKR
jgi:hypothetical protein